MVEITNLSNIQPANVTVDGTTISITTNTTPVNIVSGTLSINSSAVTSVNTQTGAVVLDSDDIAEGSTNVYYTDARADARVDLQTGANLDLSSKSTTDLSEGTNLYYTDARARSSVSASGDINYDSNTGVFSLTVPDSPVVSVNTQTGSVVLDTDDISEGTTNLYYTDTRVGNYLTANNYATTTYVDQAETDANSYTDTAIANLVDTAPATLDTLNELAAALGDDPNFATSVSTSLGNKLNTADFDSTANVWISTQNTSNLTEGSNLYYTDSRARGAISATGDISYNSITGVISYTTPSIPSDVSDLTDTTGLLAQDDFSNNTTSDLAEGTNLYFTDERVDDRVANLLVSGSNITTVYDDVAGTLTISATDTGISLTDLSVSTNPAEGSGALIYNNTNGVFTFTPADLSSITTTLAGLTDVDLTGLTNGEIIKYNSVSGKWEASPDVGIASVASDGSPQLGGNLATNGFDIDFADNNKATFGADEDLWIYHDGGSSYIFDRGTGNMRIITNSTVSIDGASGGEFMAQFVSNGAVSLWHDNSKKFDTTSTGVSITGEITTTGGNSTNWQTAYTWGNHGDQGYLTTITSESIGDLSDVDLTTTAPITNDALIYDGANWVPGAVTTGDPTKLVAAVKNVTAGTLAKGTPVHITGATGNTFHVIAARADTASAMPAAGVLAQELTANSDGDMIISGFINGVNTLGFTAGDEIYVGATGGYTNSAPTGEGNLVQKLGVVSVIDETNGSGLVQGAGRTNAIPNLDEDQFFLGNASNVGEAVDFSAAVQAISINSLSEDTSPSLAANLNAATYSISNVGNVTISGTVTGGDGFGVKFPNGIDLDGGGIINSHDGSFQRIDINGGLDITNGASGTYNSEFINTSATGSGLLTTVGTPGTATTAGNLLNARVATASGYATRFNLDYTGKMTINGAYSFPTADGTSGQVLTTDGSGNLTFTTVSGGGGGLANVVEDLTPQLGGTLDVNGNSITDSSANEYWTIGDGDTPMLATTEAIGPWITTDYTYDGSKRLRPNGSAVKVTLSTDVTGSNGRIRANSKEAILDLNSKNFTTTGGGRGLIRDYHHWHDIRNTGSAAVTLAQVRGIEMAGATIRDDNVTISSYKGILLTNGIEASNPTPATTTIVDSTGIEINSVFANTTPTGTIRSIHSTDANALMEHAGAVKIGAYTLPNTDGLNGYVLTTNGSGTVSWAPAGSGGGGSFDGNLLGNVLTDTTDNRIDMDRPVAITSYAGQTVPMIQLNINNSIDGSAMLTGTIDDQIGVNSQRVFQVQKNYEDTLGQRARLLGTFTANDTTATSDPFTRYSLSIDRPYYDDVASTARRVTQTLYEFGGDGFWNTSSFGAGSITVPSSQKMNYGVPLDFQEGAFSPYVFSDGGTAVFNLQNGAQGMTRNFVLQYDNGVSNFVAVPDSVWENTEAGAFGSTYNAFWGFGVQWKITFIARAPSYIGNATVTINNALPPSGVINNAFGGTVVPKYANTPAWANTGTRAVTMTRPASGTTFYKWTVEWFADELFIKDWEEFTLV